MQKAVRINVQARKQLAKRAKKQAESASWEEWSQYHRGMNRIHKQRQDYVKEERANRREDWLLGPLAPKRDAGKEHGTYGALEGALLQYPVIPKAARGGPKRAGYEAVDYEGKDAKLRFTGRTIVGNVVAGDRVCVVRGPEHIIGKVGIVASVDIERECVRVSNVNMVDMIRPETAPQDPNEDPENVRFFNMEAPIPMADIRLVATRPSDDRDVVIDTVYAGPPYVQRQSNSNLPAHTRYVAGSARFSNDGKDFDIPWPDEQFEDEKPWTDGDTLPQHAEEVSWLPKLQAPLGYEHDIDLNMSALANPESKYNVLSALQKEKRLDKIEDLISPNILRAGIAGYTSYTAYETRRNKIAAGIMNELRGKGSKTRPFYDDLDWVKRRTLEDARSLWWEGRVKNVLVASESGRQTRDAVEQKRIAREEQNAKEVANLEDLIKQVQIKSAEHPNRRELKKLDTRLRKELAYAKDKMIENAQVGEAIV